MKNCLIEVANAEMRELVGRIKALADMAENSTYWRKHLNGTKRKIRLLERAIEELKQP